MLDDKNLNTAENETNHDHDLSQDTASQTTDLDLEALEETKSSEDTLREEVATLKDQLLRQMAESENSKKRSQREKDETRQYAISNFARDLLSVADNLKRALQTLEALESEFSTVQKNFIEGVRLTERELESIFTRQGIKKVSPLGEKFDHNFHQAMFEAESEDQEVGTVTQVLQEGYVIQDRLLRPAMVGVAKAKVS
ncbi:MAG: nucleotide exchange factor GrpE [Janthinobacterium lividum]